MPTLKEANIKAGSVIWVSRATKRRSWVKDTLSS